jgi:hypothetical protein
MKKIILLSIFIVSTLGITNTYAEGDEKQVIKVKVTEKMPWMKCDKERIASSTKENPVYECYVESGF